MYNALLSCNALRVWHLQQFVPFRALPTYTKHSDGRLITFLQRRGRGKISAQLCAHSIETYLRLMGSESEKSVCWMFAPRTISVRNSYRISIFLTYKFVSNHYNVRGYLGDGPVEFTNSVRNVPYGMFPTCSVRNVK